MPRVPGKRVHVCIVCFSKYKFGALVIMPACACMRVYLHARLYVCVGGARASHLCGMRCYIPSGMPQRETERKEEGGVDVKRWNGRGWPQLFLNYIF